MKNSVKIVDVTVKIRNRHLLSRSPASWSVLLCDLRWNTRLCHLAFAGDMKMYTIFFSEILIGRHQLEDTGSYLYSVSPKVIQGGHPCGGGVEYLHRDPASRRRRRKGKSRIWDSKIWPPVLRDSDQKMTALARSSCNCNRQTRPLVREGVPNQQIRNCQTIKKIWS
jgi:hypothetical protein